MGAQHSDVEGPLPHQVSGGRTWHTLRHRFDRSVPRISQNWGRFGFVRDMRSRVRDVIQAAIDAGAFAATTNPDAAFRILITAVHGAAVGRLCSRLAPGEDADALARDTLEAVLTGLRAGFPATFHPVSWTDPSAVSK